MKRSDLKRVGALLDQIEALKECQRQFDSREGLKGRDGFQGPVTLSVAMHPTGGAKLHIPEDDFLRTYIQGVINDQMDAATEELNSLGLDLDN